MVWIVSAWLIISHTPHPSFLNRFIRRKKTWWKTLLLHLFFSNCCNILDSWWNVLSFHASGFFSVVCSVLIVWIYYIRSRRRYLRLSVIVFAIDHAISLFIKLHFKLQWHFFFPLRLRIQRIWRYFAIVFLFHFLFLTSAPNALPYLRKKVGHAKAEVAWVDFWRWQCFFLVSLFPHVFHYYFGLGEGLGLLELLMQIPFHTLLIFPFHLFIFITFLTFGIAYFWRVVVYWLFAWQYLRILHQRRLKCVCIHLLELVWVNAHLV